MPCESSFHHSDGMNPAAIRQRVNPRAWVRAYDLASDWLMWRSNRHYHSNLVSCRRHHEALHDLVEAHTNEGQRLFLSALAHYAGSMLVLELDEWQGGGLLAKSVCIPGALDLIYFSAEQTRKAYLLAPSAQEFMQDDGRSRSH